MAAGTWEDFTDKYGFNDGAQVEERDFDARKNDVENFCKAIWPDGKTPDGDLLRDADFEEIAESEWDDDDHKEEEEEEEEETPETYAAAAQRFGITLTCVRINARPDGGDWDAAARHFRCRLQRGRRSFGFFFSQGSAHTEHPSISDVLDCMVSDVRGFDDAASFEQWASDLGYDPDSRKAEKIYRAVKKQAEQMRRTLGDDTLQALYNCAE